jgi:hypothetical protein
MKKNFKQMEQKIEELENLLLIQESYFDNLIELGLFFENAGQHQKAFEIYKKGIEMAEKGKKDIAGTLLGLLEH